MKSHLLKSIGILVFAWILWKIDRNALIANLKGANFLMIIGAFLIHYIVFYFKSVRWHIFVSSTGLKTSMYQSWKLCNIGLFLSCITPAKQGGNGIKK